MSKHLSSLILCSFLASCSILKTKQLDQPHQLISIQALNLSEDRSTLSSQNDEVMVSVLFGSTLGGVWYMNGYFLPTHTFDSSAMIYAPDTEMLSTTDECQGCEVWICLTEMDEDSTEEATHQKLVDHINALGYRALDTRSIVSDALQDNDFLGYARIPYFTKALPSTYEITGQDLLDKYAYKIVINIIPIH